MNFELIGYCAAVLTTASFIPQAIKTIRSGDTASISLIMYVLFTSGVLLWLVYGIVNHNVPITAANAVTAVFASIILGFKIRNMIRRG